MTPQMLSLVSTLPPLTSVLTSLRHTGTGVEITALPHVVAAISDFLDHALPSIWNLPRACKANLLSLLPRLATRGISNGVDPCYWMYQCGKGLVSAVKHDSLEMVEWLHGYCPNILPYTAMIEAAKHGKPAAAEVAVASPCERTMALSNDGESRVNRSAEDTAVFEAAVQSGHIDAVKWLFEEYGQQTKWARYYSGDPQVTRFLLEHRMRLNIRFANVLLNAAEKGDLEMVQRLFFEATPTELDRSIKPIDAAARNGHLHVVKWLHVHQPEGAMAEAMDWAAYHGSLEVVQWLHENRSEGCTIHAMNHAALQGHLDIVWWLHANRTEGCAPWAMGFAAENGYRNIVQWLHENRTEGCTAHTMDGAAEWGAL